jgi:hypothetical protein
LKRASAGISVFVGSVTYISEYLSEKRRASKVAANESAVSAQRLAAESLRRRRLLARHRRRR